MKSVYTLFTSTYNKERATQKQKAKTTLPFAIAIINFSLFPRVILLPHLKYPSCFYSILTQIQHLPMFEDYDSVVEPGMKWAHRQKSNPPKFSPHGVAREAARIGRRQHEESWRDASLGLRTSVCRGSLVSLWVFVCWTGRRTIGSRWLGCLSSINYDIHWIGKGNYYLVIDLLWDFGCKIDNFVLYSKSSLIPSIILNQIPVIKEFNIYMRTYNQLSTTAAPHYYTILWQNNECSQQ